MDLNLKDKNALVTGGERGIGRDICLSLAREGANIAYCDIQLEAGGESTQERVRSLGRKSFVERSRRIGRSAGNPLRSGCDR